MKTIEIARRLAELREKEQALKAYSLALGQEELSPEEELEAATYLFFSKGDYRIAYTHMVELYNRGNFRDVIMDLLTNAFYMPNVAKLEKAYQKNKRALADYPYLFRKDFLPMEDAPIRFFPFDDEGFVPYYVEEDRFGDYINVNKPVIDRYFFKDLSKPILASDVYSQYQLEYLYDNIRPSEWVSMENHIYLHYTSWKTFCAYLQVLNIRKVLDGQKVVFLMEEERSRYPIDFKAEYGIDYSEYPLRSVHPQEIKRLIWHTQLASDNGGDFFNQIFYEHPNLLATESLMFDSVNARVKELRRKYKKDDKVLMVDGRSMQTSKLSDKDAMVLYFLTNEIVSRPDPASRIVPAIFFQPHFSNIYYKMRKGEGKNPCALLYSEEFEKIRRSGLFQGFKYIKTFTPVRRFTTSYAATMRSMVNNIIVREVEENAEKRHYIPNQLKVRLLNWSFMADPQERLFQDSCLVRFEDGKLNPKATFTALAEFLDLPYADTMTYCSNYRGINQPEFKGSYVGFDTKPVYNTYDEFTNDEERAYLEYFLKDAYAYFGYDFHYYHGEPVDEAWIKERVGQLKIEEWIETSQKNYIRHIRAAKRTEKTALSPEEAEREEAYCEQYGKQKAQEAIEDLREIGEYFLSGPKFVNKNGQPLHFIKKLELDPELLEQPLYH